MAPTYVISQKPQRKPKNGNCCRNGSNSTVMMTQSDFESMPLLNVTHLNTSLLTNEADKDMSLQSFEEISPEHSKIHSAVKSQSIKLNLVPAQRCSAH